jgi:uncharacterized protein (TIGR02757 family)
MQSTRKERLEALYRKYNRRKYVHPDPLEFLYDYPDPGDREVVGMVAASLAYGRVKQILKSVAAILGRMGPSPCRFVMETSDDGMHAAFGGFVHRFATGKEVACLLVGIREMIASHGSLQAAFRSYLRPDHETVFPALSGFCRQITAAAGGDPGHLLPLPERGSACKRMNLFLRWMVRKDAVDPGGWNDIPKESLIVPLDVHMFRIGRELGFTSRKQANMKAALEITEGFRAVVPEDPVRYDFVLTRPGIRGDMEGIEFAV